MSNPDVNQAQARIDSKNTDYLTPTPDVVGNMANVTGVACNISGITPAERAARDA